MDGWVGKWVDGKEHGWLGRWMEKNIRSCLHSFVRSVCSSSISTVIILESFSFLFSLRVCSYFDLLFLLYRRNDAFFGLSSFVLWVLLQLKKKR